MPISSLPRRTAAVLAIVVAFGLRVNLAQDKAAPNNEAFRAGGKSFQLPPPSDDLVELGSDYRVKMEVFVPDSNRLVAGYVPQSVVSAVRDGTAKSFDRYAMVEIPRRAEFSDVSADLFSQITDAVSQQFGAQLEATIKDQQEAMNRRLKAINSDAGTITLDEPTQLGAFFSKKDACAFGSIMPFSGGAKTINMLMGMMVLRVQERLLFAYVYTDYNGEGSADWMRKTTEAWADAILRLNNE